ncbi:arsenate-mycothiol transferase ArsC [Mangrovimonas spongiae]|uniref:Protein-tyrosine-phosphatase n=1 Tax=Mangrovimonas spongiae TaxID=2494697 RepID=A0A3R9MDS6_9FLAO|nr:protein-tyrosine-phosphatase [Mangrovimonas spongiae]RSK39683.1 protein-tyrosine-phosphatase [Mangrovimonas spongiae]
MFLKLIMAIEKLQTISISDDRKATLQPLIDFIQNKIDSKQSVNINFICTHNSRRSHLSQIWSQALASYFNVPNVYCYSGGTEETAMFPMIAKVLEQSGFQIQKLSNENNPIYTIKYAENSHPIIGFSKRMDSEFNPKSGFAAVMTCSQADAGCPFVPGAEKRIPITFEDPKVFDGTPEQEAKYKERSLQIAAEMYYVFSNIK